MVLPAAASRPSLLTQDEIKHFQLSFLRHPSFAPPQPASGGIRSTWPGQILSGSDKAGWLRRSADICPPALCHFALRILITRRVSAWLGARRFSGFLRSALEKDFTIATANRYRACERTNRSFALLLFANLFEWRAVQVSCVSHLRRYSPAYFLASAFLRGV
jgi:hypothetical protein